MTEKSNILGVEKGIQILEGSTGYYITRSEREHLLETTKLLSSVVGELQAKLKARENELRVLRARFLALQNDREDKKPSSSVPDIDDSPPGPLHSCSFLSLTNGILFSPPEPRREFWEHCIRNISETVENLVTAEAKVHHNVLSDTTEAEVTLVQEKERSSPEVSLFY